jgi:hypothetical protein
MGRRVMKLMTVVGVAALLISTAAVAQHHQRDQGGQNQGSQNQGSQTQGSHYQGSQGDHGSTTGRGTPWLTINGNPNPALSQSAVRSRSDILVPSSQLFQALGGQEQRQRGWAPPGSAHPDTDRNQDWTVVRRGDRELRFRPGERQYYYGNQPHYFSTEPFDRDGSTYIPLDDIIQLFGGTYDWNQQYGYGSATVWPYGQVTGPDQLYLTYPANGASYDMDRIKIEGFAPAYRTIRVTIEQEAPFTFTSRVVFAQVLTPNRNGQFSTWTRLPNTGTYRAIVEVLDEYGRAVSTQTSRFYAR